MNFTLAFKATINVAVSIIAILFVFLIIIAIEHYVST